MSGERTAALHADAYYLPEHGDRPLVLSRPEDVDDLVDLLLGETLAHSIAALYHRARPTLPAGVPDHELYLAVDGDRRVGALMFMDVSGNWASRGYTGGRVGAGYRIMGNETGFPPGADVPIGLVRRAGKEFLLGGGHRPTCVEWQDARV